MTAVPGSITDEDVDEFVRGYARPDGWRGATGLYTSMLSEGDDLKALAASRPLSIPTLAVGGFGGSFTEHTLNQMTDSPSKSVLLEGVEHYVALEAPNALANAIPEFLRHVDGT